MSKYEDCIKICQDFWEMSVLSLKKINYNRLGFLIISQIYLDMTQLQTNKNICKFGFRTLSKILLDNINKILNKFIMSDLDSVNKILKKFNKILISNNINSQNQKNVICITTAFNKAFRIIFGDKYNIQRKMAFNRFFHLIIDIVKHKVRSKITFKNL